MDLKTLRDRQAWTLPQKIDHSIGVIEAFASWYEGKVFVSFSGGKDSSVMLHLVEMVLPDVPVVFVMTGCESPSVCRFIRQQQDRHRIEIIRPKKTLRQVFAECGFPLVSKRVSHDIDAVRRNPYCQSSRLKLRRDTVGRIPERWMYLLNEPYKVSDLCCYWLKKQPSHEYMTRTGRKPYIGLMASEGDTRAIAYIRRGGCNTFGEGRGAHPSSWPLAIWTEQDVWQFIKDRHIELPDIYERGATRTGCMGCGFGAHLDHSTLDVMQREWPRWYDMVRNYENNGVKYGDAIDLMMTKANTFPRHPWSLSRDDEPPGAFVFSEAK